MLIGTAFKTLCYGSRPGFCPPCNTSLDKYRYGTVPQREWERSTIHSFVQLQSVFRIRIRDPVPFWPGVSNQDSDPRSGMKFPNHISETLETIFGLKKLKFFDADQGSGIFLFRDGKIWIRDKHPGSATLLTIPPQSLPSPSSIIHQLSHRETSILYLLIISLDEGGRQCWG